MKLNLRGLWRQKVNEKGLLLNFVLSIYIERLAPPLITLPLLILLSTYSSLAELSVTFIILFFLCSTSKPIGAATPWITTFATDVNNNHTTNSLVPPQVLAPLKYHNGPVMSPDITVHIVWYGNWAPASKRVIREFINSFSASGLRSPSVSDWWKVVQKYADRTNANVSRTVQLGKEKNDRFLSHGTTLNRFSVQLVIKAAIHAKTNPLPVDPKGGLYLVLTADDIMMEDFCSTACGFHFFVFPATLGYALPYAWVGNSGKMCPGFCAYPFAVPTYMPGWKSYKPPNGDVAVDGMISVIAHEIAELATNPLINAWYAGEEATLPMEIADFCQGVYGVGAGGGLIGVVRKGKDGAVYNMFGIRRRFLVQWVWDHVKNGCNGP